MMASDTIDIREWKMTGDDLKKEIVNAVRDTQRYVIQTLPNKLVMTPAQYDDLQHDPEMHGFYKEQQRVYVTTENAMDVIIE
jgi:hypothetical protein